MAVYTGDIAVYDPNKPEYKVVIDTNHRRLSVSVVVYRQGKEDTAPISTIERLSRTYPNLIMLSEALRDEVGLGPAEEFLERVCAHAYPELWVLGRKGNEAQERMKRVSLAAK